jgi:hypothetical protein
MKFEFKETNESKTFNIYELKNKVEKENST